METDYERRLRDTLDQLQANDSLRTIEADRGKLSEYLGDADKAFELIGRAEEAPLPAELARNFHRHSGLSLAWRALPPYQTVAGEFRLVDIAEALLAGSPAWLTDMATSEQDRRFLEQLRVFDTQPIGGTGTCTAFRLTDGPTSPEIWYFDMTQGSVRLHTTYGDYLDTLLRTRGLYYWQYLFAEPDRNENAMSVALPTVRAGLDFLARAFPDDDLSDLRSRLEARERATEQRP